jgi:hypothetical protein
MYICEICKKYFKSLNALNSHMGWHKNHIRKNSFDEYNQKIKDKKIKAQNQYTKAKEEGRNIIISDLTRQRLGNGNRGRKQSEEERKIKSDAMKIAVEKFPLSYSANNVCGRTKIQEYNGKKLNGSWELIVAKWLDKYKIKWINEFSFGFEYLWQGNIHTYFPDFYLPEKDIYIEVKGYQRERDLAKWSSVNNLIVLKKKEIELIKLDNFNLFQK